VLERGEEKVSWPDRVRDGDLSRVNGERNVLQTVKIRNANWIGHNWRGNWLIKQVIEGKIGKRVEVTGRQGRRRKQLLDDLKEREDTGH